MNESILNNLESKLSSAFVSAQAEFKSAFKYADNSFFKTKYADLASIWDACSGALKKHHLAISQAPGKILKDPTRIELITSLIHESGNTQTHTMEIPILPNKKGEYDPQAIGSAITYGRRYALAAILGIVIDDDDGNKASKHHEDDFETIDREDAKEIFELAKEMGWTDIERKELLRDFGIENILDLPKDQVPKIEAILIRRYEERNLK